MLTKIGTKIEVNKELAHISRVQLYSLSGEVILSHTFKRTGP